MSNVNFRGIFWIVAVAAVALLVCLNGYQTTQEIARVESAVPQERIVDLPEDGNLYHTTLFLHDNWREIPAERELYAAFWADPRLASLRAQTHFHLYTPEMDIFPDYRVTTLPTVRLQAQRHDGGAQVIYEKSGEAIPAPQAMGDVLEVHFRERPWLTGFPCPRPRPKPKPEPPPEPPPNPDVDVDIVVPDLGPDPGPAPSDDSDFWAILAVVVSAVAGGAFYYNWRKRVG